MSAGLIIPSIMMADSVIACLNIVQTLFIL